MNTKDKIYNYIKNNINKPVHDFELAKSLGISVNDIKTFNELLDELVKERKLIVTKKSKYATPEMLDVYIGEMDVAKGGFGFVLVESLDNDIFISRRDMSNAMHGDIVKVEITKGKKDSKKCEGKVLEVLERKQEEIVGTFEKNKTFGFVVPDNQNINSDIFVKGKAMKNAKNGDKVVVKITKWTRESNKNLEGKIVEVLGSSDSPGIDVLSVIREKGIKEFFDKDVIESLKSIDEKIPEHEVKKRLDLRDETIITIDGADAKDLDDAISIKKDGDFYVLGVHIADVSHYVRENTPLDKEAIERGTSVYFVDRVIPMLPKKLSNGVCSLHPNVDRLTLSIFMTVNSSGKVIDHEIKETVINSTERMTYKDVTSILNGDKNQALEKYDYLNEMFHTMEELAKILRKKRDKRGTIDFNFKEVKVVLDDQGKAKDIVEYERGISNRIIEEFMLLANETVAEHMYWLDLPFVFRTHDNPDSEDLMNFRKVIHNFGYQVRGSGESIHPKEVRRILKKAEGKKEESLINKMLLRSLKQAKYTVTNDGHYGLATDYYCHFTSPIRRYPDLQIHRIIKKTLHNKLNKKEINRLHNQVLMISEKASKKERIAEKAEREILDLKKAEYISMFVGKVFPGVVSSVTSFGMFVELENTVEGLIRMQDLEDDYYHFDSDHLVLIGERTKNVYSIGDELFVRVENVNLQRREVDFSIVKNEQ